MRKAVRLDTREARAKLPPRHMPYWREVVRGKSVGYHKGAQSARWHIREYKGRGYRQRALGLADDRLAADGKTVLTWDQALKLALDSAATALLPTRGGATVADAATAYFAHRRAKSRSTASVKLDEGKLRAAVLPDFGDWALSDLTAADLRKWRDSAVTDAVKADEAKKAAEAAKEAKDSTDARPAKKADDEGERRERQRRAQATVNRVWTVFRAVLNHAYAEGRVASDAAWRAVKPFRNVDRPRERFLSVAECRRLLNACSPDFRQLVRAALLTGLRYGELTRLKVADYSDGAIVVQASKAGTARRVPLTDEGTEFFDSLAAGKLGDALLLTRTNGEPWGDHHQHRPMDAACKAAKIQPRATFHDLRRSYGSLLVNSGAPMAVISTALGHADSRMTQRVYARLMDSVLREELQAHLPRFEGTAKATSNKVRSIDSARKGKGRK